ncbi:uncharacterized protein SAPINGB_P002881 [Magnusiomyces paraingens]|uniref:Cytochrome b561 domain-containing protein n=1 Tax=Magnusiomyces paraingens TaxID=2606893 RepID=A0A5E8BHV8_9ASCO|nr:uncharacterized protein SAPINGB_P002881 [Saprochaete ingens]VVT50791.1 unnamed protein product [Saprochaete ingens]
MSSSYDPLLDSNIQSSNTNKVLDLAKHAENKRALIVQAGLLVLVLTILHAIFTHPIITFFAPHPILNSLGLVFLAHALLLTQPPPISPVHKTLSGRIHGILNTTAVVLFLTAFSSIFYNKAIHASPHITTWHGLFGITTYTLLSLILLFGISIYWFPVKVFGSVAKAKSFYKYHRIAGYFTLTLASLTILLALDSDYNNNVLHISYTVVGIAVTAIWGGLVLGLTPSRLGFI